MAELLKDIKKTDSFITNSGIKPISPESREISMPVSREMDDLEVKKEASGVISEALEDASEANKEEPQNDSSETLAVDTEAKPEDLTTIGESKLAEACPYCNSRNFVKRGMRKNKYQVVQLYICKNDGCGKTFTAQDVKGKHFPLKLIIEAMSFYNLGFSLEEACGLIKQRFGIQPDAATLSEWVNQYKSLCRYERLRPFAIKLYKPLDTVEVVTMAHRQLYRFRYHRSKIRLMLEEFRNHHLFPLKDFLDNVSSRTPHQYFQEGERMSEIRSKFDKADMVVRSKTNYANRLAAFVLQTVSDNKLRHEALQRFMLANDSCTVSTEVPVYIRKEDIIHMENALKFKITQHDEEEETKPTKKKTGKKEPAKPVGTIILKGSKIPQEFPNLLTGHIDFIQLRNGQVHLLDYKPNAAKENPIEQLTWYAIAMSRLTGLRLFEFKCAWFDEKDYFEFYPLHVVKKLGKKRKRNVHYRSGLVAEIPQSNTLTIIK